MILYPPGPMWDVVEEHLEEAEFLWGQWERSLVAPNYTLEEVTQGPEQRLIAHIQGLVINGPIVARKLLIPALEEDEPDLATAAAIALLLSPGDTGIEAVFEALHELPEQRPALARALEFSHRPELRPRMRELLGGLDVGLVAVAAQVLAFHHEAIGDALPALLASDEPAWRALALRALPDEPSSPLHTRALLAGLVDYHPAIADAAIDAGTRMGIASAWGRARERAQDPGGTEAMLQLALGGTADDRAQIFAALQHPRRRPGALWALGFVGTPEVMDSTLEWLDDDAVGPLVGELFSAVTGVDLGAARLTAAPVEAERLTHAPEHDLLCPNPMAVLRWWTQRRAQFTDGQRYLGGRPHTRDRMLLALAQGPMRRRPPLLRELQLQTPQKVRPRLQLRAPTTRQRSELTALRAS